MIAEIKAVPPFAVTVTAAVTAGASLSPSLLPRSSGTQAIFSGLLVAAGPAILASVRHAVPERPSRAPHQLQGNELRILTAAAGAAFVVVIATVAHHWQNALRAAMDVPSIGLQYWLEVVAGTGAIVVLTGGTARGLRVLAGRLTQRGVAAAVLTITSVVAVCGDATSTPNAAPVAHSSSPDLGEHGRRFVSIDSGGAPVRVYASLSVAPTVQERAAFAVDELDRSGGFDRGHLVVAIPTGSGWVDEQAVRGFESRWGDDVAIVAQQYADTPSWVTFVFDRDAATESARSLVAAVRAHLELLPEHRRPRLHVYGQSLGAVGGNAAFENAPPGPCDALWAGPPAGTVHSDGATVLANTSDPVVWWQPSLLWSPPDLSRARRDAPVPPWIPVIGFLQTTVDMVASLDAAPGHGHRYGSEQAACSDA